MLISLSALTLLISYQEGHLVL